MQEGLEAAEDEEALLFVSNGAFKMTGTATYNVDEHSSKDCARNSVAILGVLVSTQHGMTTRLEERSDRGQDDDGKNRQDNACPCIHGGDNGLDHGGRLRALRLFRRREACLRRRFERRSFGMYCWELRQREWL